MSHPAYGSAPGRIGTVGDPNAVDAGGLAPALAHPLHHPIHGALVRAVRYLGVERSAIGLEVTLCLAVLVGARLHPVALGLVAAVACVVHPVLVWATARDAQVLDVTLRSRAYADYYAPHGRPGGAARRPRASVPGRR